MYANTNLNVDAHLHFRISTYDAEAGHVDYLTVMCSETGEDAFGRAYDIKRRIADSIENIAKGKTDSVSVRLPRSTHVYANIHSGRTVWRDEKTHARMLIARDADTEGVRIAMEAEDDTLRDVAIDLDENDLHELLQSIR